MSRAARKNFFQLFSLHSLGWQADLLKSLRKGIALNHDRKRPSSAEHQPGANSGYAQRTRQSGDSRNRIHSPSIVIVSFILQQFPFSDLKQELHASDLGKKSPRTHPAHRRFIFSHAVSLYGLPHALHSARFTPTFRRR
jgi:hypothetical protein